jgi:hypothetical protein
LNGGALGFVVVPKRNGFPGLLVKAQAGEFLFLTDFLY